MKFTQHILINQPLEKVVALFDDPESMKHWQPGLQSFETISGEPGQPGSKARLKYKIGNREVEMIETIVKRDLPREYTFTFETKGVYNYNANRFETAGPGQTLYTSENEFRFSGFMKLMGWLMPGAFKKQSMKYLELFRNFAESQ